MSAWAAKMQRRAVHLGSAVTSCAHSPAPYPCRMEKVKFGVPLDQVCKPDIPGPLLILILKLNKEGPLKKDVFRAPGHQANVKKLIHFLQSGRLVNIANFSVHTVASVLKKFLRKLPQGVFGVSAEKQLFDVVLADEESADVTRKCEQVKRIVGELPRCAQQLLVLLFGTFRAVASCSVGSAGGNGMTAEALGVSVAPSFFHSCVGERQATMEDVMKFKAATRIMKFLIDHFGKFNLFGTENYRYYARITGRFLKIEDSWIVDFGKPLSSEALSAPVSLEAEMTWLQYAALLWKPSLSLSGSLGDSSLQANDSENSSVSKAEKSAASAMAESARLSTSLEGGENFAEVSSSFGAACFAGSPTNSSCSSSSCAQSSSSSSSNQTVRARIRPLEERTNCQSLTLLPQVHQRQTERMRTRSEWFLSANRTVSLQCGPDDVSEDS